MSACPIIPRTSLMSSPYTGIKLAMVHAGPFTVSRMEAICSATVPAYTESAGLPAAYVRLCCWVRVALLSMGTPPAHARPTPGLATARLSRFGGTAATSCHHERFGGIRSVHVADCPLALDPTLSGRGPFEAKWLP